MMPATLAPPTGEPSPHRDLLGHTPQVDQMFAQAYPALRGLAHQVRGTRASPTLDTAALVHETFLKLTRGESAHWHDESHFFAIAARAMRQIVTDSARRGLALKRGGGDSAMTYDDALHSPQSTPEQVLVLDEALERLHALDPRRAQVVEHRLFGGFSTPDTARVMGISTATVERDWRAARAWLAAEMTERADDAR